MIFFGQIKNEQMELVNGLQLKDFLKKSEGKQIQVMIQEKPNSISSVQRASLNLWFTQMAEALNSAGYEVSQSVQFEIPHTKQSIKEAFWKPIQKAIFHTDDTEALANKDITKIYEILNREIANKTGVHVPWPQRRKVENQLQLKYN